MNNLQCVVSILEAIIKLLDREQAHTLFSKLSEKDRATVLNAVRSLDVKVVRATLEKLQISYSNYLFMSVRELRKLAQRRRISYQGKRKMDIILDLIEYDEEC